MPDKFIPVTRYLHNRAKWEPHITAEFKAVDFDECEDFAVGKDDSSRTTRGQNRSGITNYL